jgi:hypothetical protein
VYPPPPARDTWTWDGSEWRLLPADRARKFGHIVHAAHDGQRLVATDNDGWWRLTSAPASASALQGAGCAGSLGVPEVRTGGRPWLGNLRFRIYVAPTAPWTIAGVLASTATAVVPIGGCTLHLLDPSLCALGIATASGHAGFTLPIPDAPALRGAVVYVQGFAADPQGSLFGIAVLTAMRTLQLGD